MESTTSWMKSLSEGAELRDKEDPKHHWREKCCNKFKKPTGKSGAATDFILKCQRVQLLIHKKNESSLFDDGSGNSSSSDKKEDHDTSWMEELQERSNTDNQQTNFPNKSTETVLGVTDVNSPSDDAAAAEEGGTVVNGAGNVSQIFLLSKKFTFNSCKSFTNLFVQESANIFLTVLMNLLPWAKISDQC